MGLGIISNQPYSPNGIILKKETSDATPANLVNDASEFNIEDENVYLLKIHVVAKNATDDTSAGWNFFGLLDNISAPSWLVFDRGIISEGGSGFSLEDVSIGVTAGTPDELNIEVTGKAGKTIRWTAFIEWVDVK